MDPNNSFIIYAGTAGNGLIFRSTNGGGTWQTIHDPASGGVAGFTGVASIAINPADNRIIYAVGGSGATKVIVSINCGVSWSNVASTGITAGQPAKVLIDSINNLVYVVERTILGKIYQESLVTAGSGSCPTFAQADIYRTHKSIPLSLLEVCLINISFTR